MNARFIRTMFFPLLILACLLILRCGDAHAQTMWFTRPADTAKVIAGKNGPEKGHELRRGGVELSPELLAPQKGAEDYRRTKIKPSRNADDTASIGLFPDVTYDVAVESVKHRSDSTIVMEGKLRDHKIRTVVMTVGPDAYLITVQDMNNGLLYR